MERLKTRSGWSALGTLETGACGTDFPVGHQTGRTTDPARTQSHCNRRGIVLVETALVFPLLILLTLGLLEYGWMFLKSQQLTNAARHGARIGITADATNADVNAAIQALMDTAGMGGSGYTVTFTPGDAAAMDAGETLTITVSVSYANVDLGLPLVPVPTNLKALVSMAKENP